MTAADDTAPREWERFDTKRRLLRFGLVLVVLGATVASWRALDVRYVYIETALENIADLFGRMYPPDAAYAGEIVDPMIQTINIAVIGTILALLLAAPVAYISARNTTPNRATHALGTVIVAGSRSIHSLIWGLVFVIVFGTGVLAGILAVAFRSIGFIAKLLSEEIEEIDAAATEAIRATGGSELDVLIYGILPQIKPALAGISVYRWDINVREATIIGFVGAGGIGVELQNSIGAFRWNAVLTILIAILIVVVASESISAYVRRKVR